MAKTVCHARVVTAAAVAVPTTKKAKNAVVLPASPAKHKRINRIRRGASAEAPLLQFNCFVDPVQI
jgi:hypothetical protein